MQYPVLLRNPVEYWRDKASFKFLFSQMPCWILIAIEGGRFTYTIDSVSGEAGAGDVVICPPDAGFYREIVAPLSFFLFFFRYREDDPAVEQRVPDRLRRLFQYKFTSSEQDRLFSNFRHLQKVYAAPDPISRRWSTHCLNDVWMLFCTEAESMERYGDIASDPLMRKAKQWIEEHAFENLQLREVADRLELHPAQFSRRFRSAVGISPSRYLHALRMEKARALLVQTDYTLDHVAQLCGYDNGFYFSRVFTRFAKVNPSMYRKLHMLPSPL